MRIKPPSNDDDWALIYGGTQSRHRRSISCSNGRAWIGPGIDGTLSRSRIVPAAAYAGSSKSTKVEACIKSSSCASHPRSSCKPAWWSSCCCTCSTNRSGLRCQLCTWERGSSRTSAELAFTCLLWLWCSSWSIPSKASCSIFDHKSTNCTSCCSACSRSDSPSACSSHGRGGYTFVAGANCCRCSRRIHP